MTIKSNGPVGIGTASPAHKLDVSGGDIAIEGGGKLVFPQGGLGVSTLVESWGIKYAGNSTHPFQIANGGLLVGYGSSGGTFAVGSAAFAGKVGVGTTNPSSNLQVDQGTTGPGLVSVTIGSPSVSGAGTEFTNTFKVGDSITVGGQARTISVITSDTQLTVSLNFTTTQSSASYTLGEMRLAVKGNGSLELRKDAPSAMGPILTLNNKGGSGNAAIYMSGYEVGAYDPAAAVKFLDYCYSAHIAFSTKEPNAPEHLLQERLRIRNDGNVGIGTTDPTVPLEVKGVVGISPSGTTLANNWCGNLVVTKPIASAQFVDLVRGNTICWSLGYVYNTNNFAIGKAVGDEASFVNPQLVIRYDSGNVGIATTAPDTKLHVNGAITLGAAGGPQIISGSGAPSDLLPNGSLYMRTDSGVHPYLYVRENGVWVGK